VTRSPHATPIVSIGCGDAWPPPRSGGTEYPQRECEVTAGGRVRYLVDQPRLIVYFVYASVRHPKDTDG
jgi:hypothetical protein